MSRKKQVKIVEVNEDSIIESSPTLMPETDDISNKTYVISNTDKFEAIWKQVRANGKKPTLADDGSACYDVYASTIKLTPKYIEYGLGFKTIFSPLWEVQVRSRSSISNKDLYLANGVGTIDSSYRQEWKVRFKLDANQYNILKVIREDANEHELASLLNQIPTHLKYNIGDKIAQIIPQKVNRIENLDENWIEHDSDIDLDDVMFNQYNENNTRTGGFGHSGN